MDAQHGFQWVGFSAAAGLGIERLNHPYQARPGRDLIHLGRVQTKDLDCLMDIYTVSKAGRLVRDTVF